MLDRTICMRGYIATSAGTPPEDAPIKGEYAVSAFDPTLGGPYGAFIYLNDCAPIPDITVSATEMSATYTVLQPSRVYAINEPTFVMENPIDVYVDIPQAEVDNSIVIEVDSPADMMADSMNASVFGNSIINIENTADIIFNQPDMSIIGDANTEVETPAIVIADNLSATIITSAGAPTSVLIEFDFYPAGGGWLHTTEITTIISNYFTGMSAGDDVDFVTNIMPLITSYYSGFTADVQFVNYYKNHTYLGAFGPTTPFNISIAANEIAVLDSVVFIPPPE